MAGGPGGTGGGVNTSSLLWAIVMSTFAAFGGILFGYDTGTIGGIIAMEDWLHTFGKVDPTTHLTYLPTKSKSLVVSILSAGTFVGALLSFPTGDIIGRKYGLVVSCLVFCMGVGLQIHTSWAVFVTGRAIAGLGVGLISCLVPMYQSECAPKSMRGLVVGMYQLAITIGALLAAIVLNATKDQQSHFSWRTPIMVQFAWAAVLGGGMLFLPESPRYLLYKSKVPEAKKAISRLLRARVDAYEVEAECKEIMNALQSERASGQGTSYLDCFRNNGARNGFRTWTGIILQGWQQLTGINFIFYYGTTFFYSAGIKNPFVITILCDIVNTTATIIGIFLIDRVGRRRLLLIGAVGMGICEYFVAIIGITAGNNQPDGTVNIPAQRMLIITVCVYIAFFATSWGPVPWVITGEIFPLAIRAKSMSLSVASNWIWNFCIAYATPYLVNKSTSGLDGIRGAGMGVKVFFIWGSTCIGCFLFAYFFIPETRGLSLEQIDLLYKESSIVESNSYREQILAMNESYTTSHEKDTTEAEEEKV